MNTIPFISSIGKPTNPETHGGQEMWASLFILESVKRQQSFDLFAAGNSLSVPAKINLFEVLDKSIDDIAKDASFESQNLTLDLAKVRSSVYGKIALMIKQKEAKYKFVIDSSGQMFFIFNWDLFSSPLIVIGHFPVTKNYVRVFKYFKLPPNVYYVFPSKFQYDAASWISKNNKFVAPHGIDLSMIRFSDNDQKTDIVWVGRIDPGMPKGLIETLQVSSKIQIPLQIFGHIEDKDYFDKEIKPLFTSITCFNEGSHDKNTIFRNSKLFLFPIQWEEAFGLVMVESMASGTPVVAFARGSVPEVVKDGETGFIVNSSPDDIRGDWIVKKTGVEGLCEAVEKIYSMPFAEYRAMRRACRQHVEQNFTVEKMVDNYERVYEEILSMRKSL